MPPVSLMPFSLVRMFMAVEKVRQRLLRATDALNRAQIPYAVVGGNAVAAWVSRVDEEAIRNTKDVDILWLRDDLDRARSAVHVIIADEPVATGDILSAPHVDESEDHETYRILHLEALVRMKLAANRDADRVHIRDLIGVGLIDASWLCPLPSRPRLKAETFARHPQWIVTTIGHAPRHE